MSNFYLWTIYKHPKDYPDSYVARKFVGETPTDEVIVSKQLGTIQDELEALGLVKLASIPGDDPVIVETWM
ncbi:MAG: hypothetical protein ACRC2V_09930 [Xenococcaceae cyanobacterium]